MAVAIRHVNNFLGKHMAIIIRRNKKTARIMRQEYVRKDSEGNAHGFVRQVPLATISLSATEVPGDIAKLLSTKELGRLERAVVIPARATAERLRKEAEARDADPAWRAQEALRWLREIADRCHQTPLCTGLRQALVNAVADLGPASQTRLGSDPIDTAVEAVRAATSHIENGFYGRNDGPVRKDALASKKWTHLRGVLLNDSGSLLAALQEMGWVVRRGAGKIGRAHV